MLGSQKEGPFRASIHNSQSGSSILGGILLLALAGGTAAAIELLFPFDTALNQLAASPLALESTASVQGTDQPEPKPGEVKDDLGTQTVQSGFTTYNVHWACVQAGTLEDVKKLTQNCSPGFEYRVTVDKTTVKVTPSQRGTSCPAGVGSEKVCSTGKPALKSCIVAGASIPCTVRICPTNLTCNAESIPAGTKWSIGDMLDGDLNKRLDDAALFASSPSEAQNERKEVLDAYGFSQSQQNTILNAFSDESTKEAVLQNLDAQRVDVEKQIASYAGCTNPANPCTNKLQTLQGERDRIISQQQLTQSELNTLRDNKQGLLAGEPPSKTSTIFDSSANLPSRLDFAKNTTGFNGTVGTQSGNTRAITVNPESALRIDGGERVDSAGFSKVAQFDVNGVPIPRPRPVDDLRDGVDLSDSYDASGVPIPVPRPPQATDSAVTLDPRLQQFRQPLVEQGGTEEQLERLITASGDNPNQQANNLAVAVMKTNEAARTACAGDKMDPCFRALGLDPSLKNRQALAPLFGVTCEVGTADCNKQYIERLRTLSLYAEGTERTGEYVYATGERTGIAIPASTLPQPTSGAIEGTSFKDGSASLEELVSSVEKYGSAGGPVYLDVRTGAAVDPSVVEAYAKQGGATPASRTFTDGSGSVSPAPIGSVQRSDLPLISTQPQKLMGLADLPDTPIPSNFSSISLDKNYWQYNLNQSGSVFSCWRSGCETQTLATVPNDTDPLFRGLVDSGVEDIYINKNGTVDVYVRDNPTDSFGRLYQVPGVSAPAEGASTQKFLTDVYSALPQKVPAPQTPPSTGPVSSFIGGALDFILPEPIQPNAPPSTLEVLSDTANRAVDRAPEFVPEPLRAGPSTVNSYLGTLSDNANQFVSGLPQWFSTNVADPVANFVGGFTGAQAQEPVVVQRDFSIADPVSTFGSNVTVNQLQQILEDRTRVRIAPPGTFNISTSP